MSRRIIIASISLALILAAGFGIYYGLSCQREGNLQKPKVKTSTEPITKEVYAVGKEIALVEDAIQDTLITILKKGISLPEENNGIRYVVKTFELTGEIFGTIRIAVYKYEDENYVWKEDYEGGKGWGDRDFKAENRSFQELSLGSYKGKQLSDGYYSMPYWVKEFSGIKFRINDDFFPPAGSYTRTFSTFIDTYLIEIHYITSEGAGFIDYEDRSKGIIFDKQNQIVIEKIEEGLENLNNK